MENLDIKKIDDKNFYFSKINLFINSFDKEFKELMSLQDKIFKILNDTIKNISRLDNGG